MRAGTRDAALCLALAAAAALAFFAAGAPLLGLTDLHHDEAVHGQMALEWMSPSPRGDSAIWPWPWYMKDTYQGSLKTIVLAAAFRAFGVSPQTLRAATLGLGALSVFFLILFAARRHGPAWALGLAPLLATSPGLVLATCYDSGPVALGLLLRSGAIFLLGEALRRPARLGWLLAAGLALGAGVWDKAHFLWLLLAAVPAAAVLGTRPRVREAAVLAAGVFLGAWPIILFNLRYPLYTFLYAGTQPAPLAEHLSRWTHWAALRLDMAAGALTGTAPFHYSGGMPPFPWPAAAVPLIAAAALGALARRKRWADLREPAFWSLVVAGVLLIAFAAPLPVKWHHFPLVSSLLGLAALSLARSAFGPAPSRAVRFALGATVLAASLGQLSFLGAFRAAASRGSDPAVPRGMDALARWARDYRLASPGAEFLGDDALIGPLLLHSGGDIRPARLHGFTRTADDQRRALELFAAGKMVWLLRSSEPGALDAHIAGRERVMHDFVGSLPTERLASFADDAGRPWVTAHRAAAIGRPALEAGWAEAMRRVETGVNAELWLERADLEARSAAGAAALRSLSRAEAARPDRHQRRRIAALYLRLGSPRRAAAALEPLLRADPRDGGALIELAGAKAELGERDAALGLLSRAEQGPLDADARRRVAAIYRSLKEYRRAVAALEALPDAPRDAGPELELAELKSLLGERDAALSRLERAEGRGALDFDQRRRAYALARTLADFPRAAASLEAMARLRPRDAGLWIELAELAAKLERPGDARAALARTGSLPQTEEQRRRAYGLYAQLGDDGPALATLRPLLALRPEDAALRLSAAELEARTGERDAALASLTRAAASRPGAQERARMIRLFRTLNAPRAAAATLAALLPDAAADADLLLAHAEFAAQAGERSAALESLARVEALAPAAATRRRVAELYRELGEFPRAAAALDALLRLDPGDAGLWLERAELDALRGDKAAARKALARAEALPAGADPDGERRRRLALAHQAAGDHGRAVALFDELARRFPAEAGPLADKGLSQYLGGDARGAVATLEAAIRLEPRRPPAYLTLGAIHSAQGRRAEALKVYDEGLARVPAGDPLREKLLDARASVAPPAP